MDRAEMVDTYVNLRDSQRTLFLARLSSELTVLARDTYVAGSDDVEDPPRLRAFNEVQHQVAQHLRHLLDGNTARYPEDVIADILVESAAELKFLPRLGAMLTDATGDARTPKATGRVA